jgi:hypothetical protein
MKRASLVFLVLLLMAVSSLSFLVYQDYFNDAAIPLYLSSGDIQVEENRAVKDLALSITAGLESDYDKMVAIYDWVTGNIAYDLEKAGNITAYGSGSLYLLEVSAGICHDYAELTRDLLAEVGIEATYEKGEVFLDAGKSELHAWNHARINGTFYALDTTWGSGFVVEDRSVFVQKPRRLFLTSPQELALLHSDPEYKQKSEKEYLLNLSLQEPVIDLPEEELNLFLLSNDYRQYQGLLPLANEKRLLDLARRHASVLAEAVCVGGEFSFHGMRDELTMQATGMNISVAAMNAYTRLLYHPGIATDYLDVAIYDHLELLTDQQWDAVTIGAVRKGEIVAIIFIFVDYK